MVDGLSNYHLFNDGQSITLSNQNGETYSDASSKGWDIVAATKNGSGYQVLLDGASSYEGKYFIWSTDSSGVIKTGSGWKTTDQAVASGWEELFNLTLNRNDSINDIG